MVDCISILGLLMRIFDAIEDASGNQSQRVENMYKNKYCLSARSA